MLHPILAAVALTVAVADPKTPVRPAAMGGPEEAVDLIDVVIVARRGEGAWNRSPAVNPWLERRYRQRPYRPLNRFRFEF